jgi:quercetin dioxygenase-like cupin family protein
MSNKTSDTQQTQDMAQLEIKRLLLAASEPVSVSPAQQIGIRQLLMQRVDDSLSKQQGLLTVRNRQENWQELTKGIRVKSLWKGPEGSSVIIEFAPGASLLPHRHNWLEEGIVLKGDLQMGDLCLGKFDYHISPPGSRHHAIRSIGGALAYLRGTSLGDTSAVLKEVLGGLLPFANDTSNSVFMQDGYEWEKVADGVFKKPLWTDGYRSSCFYRLEAGAVIPGHPHPTDEECFVLDGELFLGDTLMCTGDYQLANAGSMHGEVSTDIGAMVFVRGADLEEQY